MDIQQFSTTLRDLLLVQDKVAVPGLGLFSAGLEPASFSDRGYTVNPPYRKLVFKPESLVTEPLGNAATLPVDEEELKKCVDALKAALQSERCVELPLLGKFRLTTSGELFFVPDPELDIYPDAFGLHPVSMKNHDPQQEEQITPLDIDTPIIEPAPALVPAPAPANETPMTQNTETAPSPKRKVLRILGTVLLVLVLAMLAFRLVAIVAPDFIDSILYTEEELRLLGK
ncbi:MAG: hypothetical protein KIG19_01580 [Bacteroidales bacterium]|nr:hypothetical protein [Bacteroidales bacterium]